MGKDIIHVDVWKKNDERTTYNLIYLDGKTGRSMVKRFNVTAITRDKEYDLTTGEKHSKLLYFSANPNGEAEIVTVGLTQSAKARIKQFDFDFGTIAIKGRSSQGNILTRYPVRKISMKEAGKSTLGAMRVWMDEVSGRLNTDGRGQQLGAFDTGDQLLVIYKEGAYELTEFDLSKRFDPNEVSLVAKFDPQMVISAIYFEGGKGVTLLKRFQIETSSLNQKFVFISDNKQSKLYLATVAPDPLVTYAFKTKTAKEEVQLRPAEFIDVKGWKAMGNKLCEFKLLSAKIIDENPLDQDDEAGAAPTEPVPDAVADSPAAFHAGDTIEFDVEENGQAKLF